MLSGMVDYTQDRDCCGNECYNGTDSHQHVLPVRLLFKFFVLHRSKVLLLNSVRIDRRQEITLITIKILSQRMNST